MAGSRRRSRISRCRCTPATSPIARTAIASRSRRSRCCSRARSRSSRSTSFRTSCTCTAPGRSIRSSSSAASRAPSRSRPGRRSASSSFRASCIRTPSRGAARRGSSPRWSASALGGLIYGFASARVAYVADAIMMAVATATPRQCRIRRRARRDGRVDRRELELGTPVRVPERAALCPHTPISSRYCSAGRKRCCPVFADQILHVGPEGFGLLRAQPAAGAVVASVYLAHRPPFKRAGKTLLYAVAAFAVYHRLRRVAQLLCLGGAAGNQRMADNVSVLIGRRCRSRCRHLLWRVSSVNSDFVGSSNEIGALRVGRRGEATRHGTVGRARRRGVARGGGRRRLACRACGDSAESTS